jgi:hypothetical protein
MGCDTINRMLEAIDRYNPMNDTTITPGVLEDRKSTVTRVSGVSHIFWKTIRRDDQCDHDLHQSERLSRL